MEKKKIIRRVVILAAWILVISGITTLLVAANRKKKEHICKNVVVGIKGTAEKFYIEEADILKQLEKTSGGFLVDRPLAAISLVSLEKALEKNQWILDAELYFDRANVLHVLVEEREPIARVFTTGGASFYMDSSGHRMPLIDKVTTRLPVITGYTNVKRISARDSILLSGVKKLAWFVHADSFWNAQIGQIDITPNRKFEMIPVIGDHIIRIGDAENIAEKFSRLLVFYKQIMSKAGFNRYSVVDVQFDGQVIGVNKGPVSVIDSIQLQKNIQELLKRSTIQNVSEDMLPDSRPIVSADSVQIYSTVQSDSVAVKTNPNPAKKLNPVPKKTVSKPMAKPKQIIRGNKVRPKAVMRKN